MAGHSALLLASTRLSALNPIFQHPDLKKLAGEMLAELEQEQRLAKETFDRLNQHARTLPQIPPMSLP
jgi:hypothetical protein